MDSLQHLDLLLRFNRTFNLRSAIQECVQPGDVVLDAGCGVGILSHWAIQNGAARVDAVDIDNLDVAKAIAQENGVADQIDFHVQDLVDFLKDRPTDEPYDCLFAMLYLNDPRRDEWVGEMVLELKKHLRPGAPIVPQAVDYTVSVVDWPAVDWPTRKAQLINRVDEIEQTYSIGFRSLESSLLSRAFNPFFPPRNVDGTLALGGANTLADPQPAIAISFDDDQIQYPEHLDVTVDRPGRANALVWSQRLMVGETLLFSNQTMSWIEEPLPITGGSVLRVPLDDHWRATNRVNVSVI